MHMTSRSAAKTIWFFPVLFMGGFLIKYDFLLIRVYQVPSPVLLGIRNLLFIAVFILWIHPITFRERGRFLLIIFSVVFTGFFFMNVWYNRYFGNYLSISDMLMGRGMRPAKVLMLQIIRAWDTMFLLDILGLVLLHRYCRNCTKVQIPLWFPIPFPHHRRMWIVGVLLVVIIQVFGANIRFGNNSPAMLYRRSTPAFVNVYGLIPLYMFEATLMITPGAFPPPPIAREHVPIIKNDLAGEEIVRRGQNIIAIQVESLDSNILGYRYGGREITPFLNRLKAESLYFDNFYAQHVNGSFDAELSFFTSVYPLNKNYGFKVNDLVSFDSLIETLGNHGYATVAFHGNDKTFFFRDKAYEELGFDRFYSREDYREDLMHYSNVGSTFGVNDYDFLQQSAYILKDIDQPFFAFFITVTSHTPFDFYPEEMVVEEFASIQNPLVRGYFNSMAFVDAALEHFFDLLEQEGLLDDALVVLYSDHDAGVEKEEYSSKRDFILTRQVKVPESIPLMIRHPEIAPGVSHKEGSPADLAPTILDLIGEIEKPGDFMGYSLLGPIDAPILFLHELPQLLHEGQLFVLSPDGLESAGYESSSGGRELELPEREYVLMLDYIRDVIFARRVVEP